MVRLREIQRTAAFAWSPGSAPPAIVTGTKAGAVDADFSNDTALELWDLGLDSLETVGELQPAGTIAAESRFHDIAWSKPTGASSHGIVAGALENGALELWDAEKLRTSSSSAHISSTTKHSGAAKALQFNNFRNELLATAGAKGEVFIWDLNSIENPFRLGASAARADDIECLDWNKGEKVPHILATGSSGGFVTVWDVRGKKENLTLNNFGRKAVSAVSWDPNTPTRLITAVPSDQDPLILVWDLRNSNAPERTLKGHELGVLSLDWARQDSSLLLSCGKDNRTILWNPHTGQAYGDYPVVTNWTFETRWNPHNPDLFATASFDGKIAIHSVQNTNPQADNSAAAAQPTDGEDFFAQTQTRPQGPSFSMPTAPKWHKTPIGASFGFGGKIVYFKTDAATGKSQVKLDTFAVDTAVPEAAKKFEEALKAGDIANFCEKKISETSSEEEKADWLVIETLHSGKSRKQLTTYLGITPAGESADAATNGDVKAEANGAKDEDDFFGGQSGEPDTFLADLAATKGAKTNQPFSLHAGSESAADKSVTSALILGNFDMALDICLADNRLSDAFMIAICGGQKSIDKVQRAYLKEKKDGPTYLRLLASIVGKNLWDVVHNAELKDWKEVMATLCTFADDVEFPDLCEALGDRLEEAISEDATYRRDASFCYLAGSKLEKVVKIWTQELKEKELVNLKASKDQSSFSVHAQSLQDFIEKVTVFRQVTDFKDTGISATSEWKLAPLYAKYAEYADILASHGQLEVAQKYLALLPSKYPLAEVAQQRLQKAVAKPGAQAARQTTNTSRTAQPRSSVPNYGAPLPPLPGAGNSTYTPGVPAPQASVVGYSQGGSQQPASYGNQTGYQQPGQQGVYGGGAPYGGAYQPPATNTAPPPPRNNAASPTAPPPPPKAGSGAQWNDTPENFFKLPSTSRRGTPGPAASVGISNPFPLSSSQPSQPTPPASFQKPTPAPLPPPPKAGQSTPHAPSPAPSSLPMRPTSAAANAYAPTASQQGSTLPSQIPPPLPRGASPYNAPPVSSAGPPSNRYAPAPGAAAPSGPAPAQQPPRNVAPPPNPYGRAPSNYAARPGVASSGIPQQQQPPPPQAGPPPSPGPPPGNTAGGPPQGPPSGPPRGPPRQASVPPPPSASPRVTSPANRHPSGDRTHIPASARPIFDILSQDMARVKTKAPQTYAPQVNDTEKRLNILFEHLNNEDLLKDDTITELVQISEAIRDRDFARATEILTEVMKNKLESEGRDWMIGVKRLIAMSRATSA